MTVIELKERLINKINQTKNNEILKEMYRLIENEESDNAIYILSEEQSLAVEEARKQFEKGQVIDNKNANQEINKWLGK